jgi:hypothetical protein
MREPRGAVKARAFLKYQIRTGVAGCQLYGFGVRSRFSLLLSHRG